MKKRILSALLCLCMAFPLLSTAAFAVNTATMKYINVTGTNENGEPSEFELADTPSEDNNLGVYIYGANGTETFELDEAAMYLLICNADVTLGEGGSYGELRMAGTGASLIDGNLTVTATETNTPTDNTDAESVMAVFDGESASAVTGTLSGDYTGSGVFGALDLGGHIWTMNGSDTLYIGRSLTLGTGAIAATEGAELDFDTDAMISGTLALFDRNGTDTYNLGEYHAYQEFTYTNSKWVRTTGDGQFIARWDNAAPNGGEGAKVQTAVLGGDAGNCINGSNGFSSIPAESGNQNITFTYTPQRDSENHYGSLYCLTVQGVDDAAPTQILYGDGTGDITLDDTGSAPVYTYVKPQTTLAGFTIEFYQSEAEYNFHNLNAGEGEYMIEYHVQGNGEMTCAPAPESGKLQTYNDVIRAVYASSVASVTFTMTPTAGVDPANEITEVRLDGTQLMTNGGSPTYSVDATNGVGTLALTDKANHSLEVRFTESGDQPPQTPSNNQYTVEFEASEQTNVSVNNSVLANGAINDFTENTPIVFTLSADPYNVTVVTNGSGDQDVTNAVSANAPYTLSYTPTTTVGFTLRVYWTEAEYNYATLHEGDGEFMVEYRWNGSGTVTHNTEAHSNYATYGKSTRVVLANGTTILELTMAPEQVQSISEVRQDGTIVNVSSETYIFDLSNGSNIEVTFTSAPPTPGDHFTITATAGAHGNINPSGAQPVNAGQGLQFIFSPDNGYEVDTVLVDRNPVTITEPQYGFEDVQEDHTISVTFRRIQGTAGDTATAKTKIEGCHWAYGGADAAAIEASFEAELWDMAVHEFSGVFADAAAVATAVTLSASTAAATDDFIGKNYYTYTVSLDGDDATGRIYVLEHTADYVVMTKYGSNAAEFTIVSGQEATVVKNYDTLGVFGNGAAIEGQLGRGENYEAFHVTTRAGLGANTFKLTVYKTDFVGSTVTIFDDYKAAAWGFAQAKIAEFGSSAADPAEFEVYFGNSSVELSASGLGNIGIQALVDVTSSLPDGAVTITNNGSTGNAKTFTINFNSNYYDEVPLTITYTDRTGGDATAYLTLKRVGIDIQAYQKTGDSNGSYNTNHGTDPGLQGESWGSDNYAVYASYYYPTAFDNIENCYEAPSEAIELYVTCTWSDGSVTRQTLTQAVRTNGDANSVPIDDFLLYKGTESASPVKIEVTAVKTGTTSTDFAGATLGSGAGVEWVYISRP